MARFLRSRAMVRILTVIVLLTLVFWTYLHLEYVTNWSRASQAIFRPAHSSALLPLYFKRLPLGSIGATGWLRDELQASARGLAGHHYDFYEYVTRSPWLGGDREYAKLNEGLPYWFNGLVHLAYGLNDSRLKSQVHSVADYVLTHQRPDGWIGPEEPEQRTFWARYPFFLGLTGLAEANSSWTDRVVSSLYKFTQLMHRMLKENGQGYVWHDGEQLTQRDFSWGQARSADMVLTLMWLYETHPEGQEPLLLESMRMLYDLGIKWEDWYNMVAYMKDDNVSSNRGDLEPAFEWKHGVNVAQGLKSPAVFRRITHNDSLVQTTCDAVDWTFSQHGSASGTIIADDVIVDQAPYAGSELCTTVEAMFSLSYLYQALGKRSFADRCERAAFNALPASVTSDWWAHQYMQQANQPWSRELAQSPFSTNRLSQTFGLEPNLPCCTLNHPQGYPKFLASVFLRRGDKGLAHALLSPAFVKIEDEKLRLKVNCNTAYPFEDSLHYSISASAAFDFFVRVPEWSTTSQVRGLLDYREVKSTHDATTGMLKIPLPAGDSHIEVILNPSIVTEPRPHDSVAVTRGALVYALAIDTRTEFTRPKSWKNQTIFDADYAPDEARDYSMINTSPWNFAIDPNTLRFHDAHEAARSIVTLHNGSQYVSAMACQIDWPLYKESTPGLPIPLADRKCIGDVLEVRLRPLAAAKLHIVDLPTIKLA